MRSFVIALLAITAVSATKKICEPGTTRQVDCNQCSCIDDGSTWACTLKLCTNVPLPSRLLPPPPRENCEPGKSFKHYCNTCFCNDQGSLAGCTKILCPPGVFNKDGTLIDSEDNVLIKRDDFEEPSETCEPGVSFNHYCNTCICNDQGFLVGCTKIGCPPGVFNKDGSFVNPDSGFLREKREIVDEPSQTCEPGKSFKHYCNTCFCNDQGSLAGCTKILCPPGFFNKDGTLIDSEDNVLIKRVDFEEPSETCEPGKSFKHYCNTCVCNDQGSLAGCTKIGCPPGVFNKDGSLVDPNSGFLREKTAISEKPKKICEPGTHFKQYCNFCFCGPDGTYAACSKNTCDPGTYTESGELITKPDDAIVISQNGKKCVPGETFKRYCNTCKCSGDGQRASCTRKFCLAGLYNEDGTLNYPEAVNKQANDRTSKLDRSERSVNAKTECEPGKAFKVDCNTCICGTSGAPVLCTQMACGVNNIVHKSGKAIAKQVCVPGEAFKVDCNTCICGKNGQPLLCTEMACNVNLHAQRSERAVIKQQCVPGESFKHDCNTCVCGDDGTPLLCTQIECNPGFVRPERSVNEDQCEPGKAYKKDCNTCICGADGKPFICTEIACNVEGLVRPIPAIALLEDKCEPGSSYKVDCNTCVCNADGKSAGCTKKLCINN